MYRHFYKFHRISSDHAAGRSIFPLPPFSEWPKEWKTVYYKSYSGTKKIFLNDKATEEDFFALVKKRRSIRGKHKYGINIDDLSITLKYSCGLQDVSRSVEGAPFRAQASGGARFPVEAYIVSFRKENEIAQGVYHYNVRSHALDILQLHDFSESEISKYFTDPWSTNCSAALVLTAVFHRTAMKYGERSYRYVLLEAGHIGQGVYLAGSAAGVGVSAGGTADQAVHQLIEVDGFSESLVYALMLSK
jgi:SagB-type dehydrogenase family enzyme